MPKQHTTKKKSPKPQQSFMAKTVGSCSHFIKNGGWFRKVWLALLTIALLWVIFAFSTAQWYKSTQSDKPLKYGITFIAPYASFFELDPKETLQAMIDDLGVRQYRFVSYWNVHERERGTYNFEELDWQFKMAEESGSKVSLAIGLRQPRWPECHMPEWAMDLPMSVWAEELKDYMAVVIDRYRDSPALESYQLENEFFLDVFGICPDHSRERLVDEYNFVKSIDSEHPIIISRSNNALGIPINEPQPDVSAVSIYKRVWDKTITKRYLEYPFPSWFYTHLAAMGKIVNGNDMIIHELQTEAWLPEGFNMNNIDHIPEMEKSLNAERLADRLEYGRATGIREIYVWGAEWWYWQKEKADKPDLWEAAREEIMRASNN